MSEKIVEYKKSGGLVVSKSGKTAWHAYKYKKADLPNLIADIEQQYNIHVENNHVNFIEDTTAGTIDYYFTKAGLNAIANNNHISTKIEIINRKLDYPFAFEVKATAITPTGETHEFTAIGTSTIPLKDKLSLNQVLAWTQTKARIGAIGVAMEIQNPSWEEMEDLPEMKARAKTIEDLDNELLRTCPNCGQKGYSPTMKQCKLCGITHEDMIMKEARK